MRFLVQFEVGELQSSRRLFARRTPENGTDPRGQLLEAERLGHVVVAAERETADLVLGRVPGGQEHHRRTDALGPHALDDFETVQVGQHHVEYDKIRSGLAGSVDGGNSARRGLHGKAGEAQASRKELDDVRVILNHEQSCFCLRPAGQRRTPGLCDAATFPHAIDSGPHP